MPSLTSLIINTLALAASIKALSIRAPLRSATYVDTFDNQTGTAIVPVAVVPVGFQNNINYNQFQIVGPSDPEVSVPGTHGLIKPSAPNSAGVSVRTAELSGSLSTNPSSTAYRSPAIKSFSLTSFYFGCALDAQEGVVVATSGCDISVTGYNIYGDMVGSAAFSFAPATVFEVPMVKAVLPTTFVNLDRVSFGISSGSVEPDLMTLQIDNVEHTNYW